jgi:hypothetical protein
LVHPLSPSVIDHPTSWALRGRFRDYVGLDVTGKSFLDVGAESGYNSFEAEKHGAREVMLRCGASRPTPDRAIHEHS